MAEGIRGNQVLVGSYGEVWIDGDKIFELNKIEAKILINREDVQVGMDVDSTMTGLKGELTIGIHKVFSRWADYYDKFYRQGIDKRFEIIAKLKDPNAKNGGVERFSLGNCWFNEIPIVNYEAGTPVEEEVPGGFTPSDMQSLDKISR